MLRQDSTKRYNQLAVDLLKKILNRHYLPGSKLPSTRESAALLRGSSFNVARYAS